MKRNVAVIAILAILVGILFDLIWWIMIRNNNQKKFEELMNLGNQYLLEENYEEAIVAFNKAIELAPRSVESYSKLAVAYMEVGDYEQAILVLEKGIGITEDEQLKEQVSELQRTWEMIKKLKEKYLDAIYSLITYLDEHNGELNEAVQLDEKFKEMTEDLDRPLIEKYNEKYIGIYSGGFIYYGDMIDRKREGHGNWIRCRGKNGEYIYDLFDGEWKNDYPNGYGEWKCIGLNTLSTWPIVITKGNFVDGYEDGEIENIHISREGREQVTHYSTVRGKPAVIGGFYSDDGKGYWEFDGNEVLGISGAMKP